MSEEFSGLDTPLTTLIGVLHPNCEVFKHCVSVLSNPRCSNKGKYQTADSCLLLSQQLFTLDSLTVQNNIICNIITVLSNKPRTFKVLSPLLPDENPVCHLIVS